MNALFFFPKDSLSAHTFFWSLFFLQCEKQNGNELCIKTHTFNVFLFPFGIKQIAFHAKSTAVRDKMRKIAVFRKNNYLQQKKRL